MTLQLGLYRTGKRAMIVFEGTDASGKGGTISRLVDKMDPRGFRVYPIGPPSADELARHYLQRFWRRIPRAGQLVIFDRSWYGRVLAERVEGLVEESAWRRAYKEINQFEQLLVDDNHILIKVFLAIDKDEQLERFRKRFHNPEKRWKLTQADLDSRTHWDAYQQAYEDMLNLTSTPERQWQLVAANNKLHARIESLKHIRDELSRHLDITRINIMPEPLYRRAAQLLGEPPED